MSSLFGVSMNAIMIVLVGLLAVALASVGYVALRNRIFFMMGLRNIPRRTAQTILIVVGLMLSTLIISAAFATGDTIDYSISSQAITLLGHIDATLQPRTASGNTSFAGAGLNVPADQYEKFRAALQDSKSPNIDGSVGVLFEEVPVVNPISGLSEPSVSLTGIDSGSMKSFPDVISAGKGDV